MEQKEQESNIFESVVLETAAEEEAIPSVMVKVLIVIAPVADNAVRGSGLNS